MKGQIYTPSRPKLWFGTTMLNRLCRGPRTGERQEAGESSDTSDEAVTGIAQTRDQEANKEHPRNQRTRDIDTDGGWQRTRVGEESKEGERRGR